MLKTIMAAFGLNLSGSEFLTQDDYAFMDFISKYGKMYETKSEFTMRFNVFQETLRVIREHNAQDSKTSTMGINNFADYTAQEWRNMLGY